MLTAVQQQIVDTLAHPGNNLTVGELSRQTSLHGCQIEAALVGLMRQSLITCWPTWRENYIAMTYSLTR